MTDILGLGLVLTVTEARARGAWRHESALKEA
jgi:hypothetical protein